MAQSPERSHHRSPALRALGRFPTPREGEFLVVPLGGIGRIGMNWTLYGTAGRWLLVDAGIAFPEDRNRGVDAIIPDPRILGPIADKIDGLVVTHAHEDHIGAIDRLWPHIFDCPIYATPFAAEMVGRRLEEAGSVQDVEIRTFDPGDVFEVGNFTVRSIGVTHSVPEPVALALTCAAGTILHTGDWKLDPEPLLGRPTDLEAIERVGDAGLLAMVCDSTNADRDLPITSEAQVREAFRQICATRSGAVVFCCFASNVARMASAIMAADLSDRRVALAGRSMRTNEAIADSLGMLEGVPQVLAEPRHLEGLAKREIALICTGTQGEERAALARLARGDWRLPNLGPGDTVVMSARIIPGNEPEVDAVISKLRSRGVEVLTAADRVNGFPVHVSGHAGSSELKTMHGLARPRFAIPVHGEDRHMAAHAAIALECGAQAAPIVTDGEVLAVSPAGIRSLGRVRASVMELRNDEHGNRNPVMLSQNRHPRDRQEPSRGPFMAA